MKSAGVGELKPIVSYVVVTYNSRHIVSRCLESIQRQEGDLPSEIIVVDNGSKDGTAEYISLAWPGVKLLALESNRGYAAAANLGWEAAAGTYVFLLNPDVRLSPGATLRLYEFMEQPEGRGVFACTGSMVDSAGMPVGSWGCFPSLLSEFLFVFRLDKVMPGILLRRLSPAQPAFGPSPYLVDYVCGGAIFIRRSAVGARGPFDEDFFLYFEETELCYRMRLKGWRVAVVPAACMEHLHGRSCEGGEVDRTVEFQKSKLLYFRKCHGDRYARWVARLSRIGYGVRYAVARREIDRWKLEVYRRW